MKKKSFLKTIFAAFSLLLISTTVLADEFATNGTCTPGWAPFWSTSCSYYEDGVRVTKTCKHFILTTKCYISDREQL
jgi:hypothetical protein